MIFGEVVLEKVISTPALNGALSSIFEVPTEGISVASDWSLPLPRSTIIAYEQTISDGQFPYTLNLHVYGKSISIQISSVAQKLAKAFNMRCLISDSDVNPYTMILVSADSKVSVNLVAHKLDDSSEYWLA